MVRYCVTILLGAFLLFQIQPQIARTILPWFGGGAAVWSTCMLFFQVLLLFGYAYAHLLNRRLRPGQQALVHMSLLACSLYFLPAVPAESFKPTGYENPGFHILVLLTATVGVPYLLLAATGPLMQSWFAREFAGRSPYRLYALSNVGSLVALLSFPFVFEPNLTIGIQANAWAAAYVVFVACCGACAFSTARTFASRLQTEYEVGSEDPLPTRRITPQSRPAQSGSDTAGDLDEAPHTGERVLPEGFSQSGRFAVTSAVAAPIAPPRVAVETAATTEERIETRPALPETTVSEPAPDHDTHPSITRRIGWVALAALPSVMLLAVTNTICQDLAVIPFFWVMPLSIYLLTFILTFESERWYRRGILAPLLGAAALTVFLLPPSTFMDAVGLQVTLLLAALFLCGMVCHGELVARRPAAAQLTGFYLCVAFGGALGGVFVAMLAPLFFDTYLETEIALIASVAVACRAAFLVRSGRSLRILNRYLIPAVFLIGIGTGIVFRAIEPDDAVERSRNFFGTLKVASQNRVIRSGAGFTSHGMTTLTHGTTIHGRQVHGQGTKVGQGMTYYWPGSGVAHVMRFHPARESRALRVGVVGLGAGTLAHYARSGDHHVYFEIDPAVKHIAETRFTYLAEARARGATIDVQLGDARIRMERASQSSGSLAFDILVVDAFSSDSIPVHLLTKECNAIYQSHLAKDGILAFHVSNRLLDLIPVVRGLALDAGHELRVIHSQPDQLLGANTSDWVLVTSNRDYLARDELRVSSPDRDKRSLLWTDDFSSLWHVVKSTDGR